MRSKRSWSVSLLAWLFVLFLSAPILFALVASFRTEAALFGGASSSLTLENYRALFSLHSFWRPLWSSLVVASLTTLLSVLVGSLCAYALARLRFRGKELLLSFVLAVSLFPQITLVSPLYLMLRAAGLIDTYPGLILPYLTFSTPLAVWLLVGYFRQLPRALEESALVDGATRLRILRSIVLPLSAPGIAVTALFTFIYCWNEFLFALAFTITPERQTAPVAIAMLQGRYQIPWGQILAASLLATVPVLTLALLFQQKIRQGLTSGALKG